MLFRFLRNTPDHPLADAATAGKALAGLPAGDPCAALAQIARWLESLPRARGGSLEQHRAALDLLDEAAQPLSRQLTRDYLAAARMDKALENRLWHTLFEYWKNLAAGYFQCIDAIRQEGQGREPLTALTVRAMRALAAHIKWLHLGYRPVEERTWSDVDKLCLLAEQQGFLDAPLTPYPASRLPTSVRRELLKILMLEAAGPDRLLPAQIELASRLVWQLNERFVLQGEPGGCAHCFDLSARQAPARLRPGGRVHSLMRFFGAGSALPEVAATLRQIRLAAVPQELDVEDGGRKDELLDLLAHLLLAWSATPPQRRHERRAAVARLEVAHGLAGILPRVAAADDGEPTESWVMENLSDSGLGALIPELPQDWVRIGALLGLRQEGHQHWQVGVVRRLVRNARLEMQVGIQLLAREPRAIQLRPAGLRVAAGAKVTALARHEFIPALLLPADAHCLDEACLLLEPAGFAAGEEREMLLRGETSRILLTALREQGDDFAAAGFAVVGEASRKA